jgi:hypothetical protein
MAPPKSLAIGQRLKRVGGLMVRPERDVDGEGTGSGGAEGLVTAVWKVTWRGRPREGRGVMGGENFGEWKGLRRFMDTVSVKVGNCKVK